MKKGFTLIEIAVVMFIMILISIVALSSLTGRRRQADLTNTTQQIGALLREAQSHSMADDQGVPWGVHFANATATNPFYALFTTSYSSATVVSYYRLPSTVGYVTSTLNTGSTTDVIFSQISGIASASTSVGLQLLGQNTTATISVASSGEVIY